MNRPELVGSDAVSAERQRTFASGVKAITVSDAPGGAVYVGDSGGTIDALE